MKFVERGFQMLSMKVEVSEDLSVELVRMVPQIVVEDVILIISRKQLEELELAVRKVKEEYDQYRIEHPEDSGQDGTNP